jgi:hypothetical protein
MASKRSEGAAASKGVKTVCNTETDKEVTVPHDSLPYSIA